MASSRSKQRRPPSSEDDSAQEYSYSYYSYSYSSICESGSASTPPRHVKSAPRAAVAPEEPAIRRAPTMRRVPTIVSGAAGPANGWTPMPARLDTIGTRLNSMLASGQTTSVELGPHQMPWSELAGFLVVDLPAGAPHTSVGLTSAEAARRLAEAGPNRIPPPKVKPEWLKYILCYMNMFMGLLAACGSLCFIIYGLDRSQPINLWLGVMFFTVIILTSSMTYWESRTSANIMAELATLVPEKAIVRRDGLEKEVDPVDLVLGDIVRIKSGDRVPADLRVLWSNDCKVDNSSLNGESEPVVRVPDISKSDDILLATNACFSSTLTVDGEAIGVVIATGAQCQMALIAGLAAADKGTLSPLEIEVARFVRLIAVISVFLCVVFVLLGIFVVSQKVTAAIITALGLLVANCPEGLPATVSITLSVAAKRLRKANVVVKTLQQVETLGSVSVIASDKTGTLTQNRMTCSNMWVPRSASDTGDKTTALRGEDALNVPQEGVQLMTASAAGSRLLRAATLCSRAQFQGEQLQGKAEAIEKAVILGDATEQGFLRLTSKLVNVPALRASSTKLYEIPFNSVNKFQLSIHDGLARAYPDGDGIDRVLLFKGAPEVVLTKCTHYYVESSSKRGGLKAVPIDAAFRARFDAVYTGLGARGERVLGFAEMPFDDDHPSASLAADGLSLDAATVPIEGYVFCGLISLIDPPKASVPNAVRLCRRAGIRVIMMTGDHPTTAEAIARQVGIITSKTQEELAKERGVAVADVPDADVHAVVVHGQVLPNLTTEEWDHVLNKQEIVFARMSPVHKTLIVDNCQRLGHIVAVTGDGVNDSPSLKRANVGVAMGIAGTSVSKEAADIILLDDDFNSIVLGIQVGRVIFDNLKKAVVYILVHLTSELWPVLLNIIFGLPIALQTVAMICIDLGTEIIPGVALSYESGESDVMDRPPRNPKKDHLISVRALFLAYAQLGSLQTLGSLFAFFVTANSLGVPPHKAYKGWKDPVWTNDVLFEAQTSYFFALVLSQCFTLYVMRTRMTTVFKHPPCSNKVIYMGWIWSIGLALFLIYVPGLNRALNYRPLKPLHLLLGLPGGAAIMIWAEVIKACARCRCIPLKYLQY
eukprot:c17460_g1_i2.p1 GENE.c17460_g1_i2~~c17460_g1_i2.p1  ORF type:complete len:1106 (+),score=215.35 c17460_g1_i2:37-3354(+)